MKNVLKLSSLALIVALASGCSSSGGSTGEGSAPSFDGDHGYEYVDPDYGYKPAGGEETPELGFDFDYVYIPDIDKEVPVPENPIEKNIQNPDAKISAVKQRDLDGETLYVVYKGERPLGEVVINEEGIAIYGYDSEGEVKITQSDDGEYWQVRGADGNLKGDVKRLGDDSWLIREEMTREVYISVIQDGQRVFIPASEVKGAIKDKVAPAPHKMKVHQLQQLKSRPKMG